jgi:hypothetical protein
MTWTRVWFYIRKGKRRTTYALRWFGTDGRVKTESVGPDKKLAERLRRQREAELNTGTYQEVRPMRLGAFITEHLALMQGQLCPRAYAAKRARLSAWWPSAAIASSTT